MGEWMNQAKSSSTMYSTQFKDIGPKPYWFVVKCFASAEKGILYWLKSEGPFNKGGW